MSPPPGWSGGMHAELASQRWRPGSMPGDARLHPLPECSPSTLLFLTYPHC